MMVRASFFLLAMVGLGAGAKAEEEKHWAYVKPGRPALPQVKNGSWLRNAIDHYILARLEKENLQPAATAERAKLLRRVSLDLVGLPPTPEQVKAFEEDSRPDAYERMVDELLASPHYGERWASPWLDLARYADSNGFQRDGFRTVWPYRDWVIAAFNKDMPFDQFTIEQLAGDLLPNATLEQKIATGFHRCTTVNVEAGVDREEDRVNAVFDRVNTTGTVWLGTTLICAQCHNHKYDPISQREYYQVFAYFNNSAMETKDVGQGAAREFIGPEMMIPGGPKSLAKDIPETSSWKTLIMTEMDKGRETFVFRRGSFLDLKYKVKMGVPKVLHALPAKAPSNRLGLAQWLVSRENPLVARVAVNRWWAEFFGRGLVATLEDFGTQSEPPTHPELLDWLAVEFMERGWSMKKMHRLIVTSATYQQDARVTEEQRKRDPDNRWYARGPRLRLSAEMIRDQALAASGLLSKKMGGPPVFPPQPAGLWNVTGKVDNTYRPSAGEDRYRRGVYTVWRRSSPYPSFLTFDASDRGTCTVARPRTNTPLQALTLLNDPVYVEAAHVLARRLQKEIPGEAVNERIVHGFRLTLGRVPRPEEVAILEQAYQRMLQRYQANPKAAQEVLADWQPLTAAEAIHQAAWYHLATILLNLDEAITKG